MAEDTAMGSLLAAVAVAAASSNTQSLQSSNPPSHPHKTSTSPTNHNSTAQLPTTLAPTAIPNQSSATHPKTVPPPPPLPPPLPSPPPLPPMSIRRPQSYHTTPHASALPSASTEKRKGARIFSLDEKKVLEANYARNKFPSRLHMETLGKAMGKGTEKVRTWYNNRRALDRKLGIDVNRNTTEDVQPSRYSTDSCSKLLQETIILPKRALSSPAATCDDPPQVSLRTPVPNHTKTTSRSGITDSLVDTTPNSMAWPPSISPVTTERNSRVVASPSPCSSSTRFRASPLRIRNVRLRVGQKELCGELPEDRSLDNGLEVKFLFGKKRIVYEWYCGRAYADAQSTGGPYAKMEMNFASITTMKHIQETRESVLMFSFSAFPTLFLQTPESMMKYRIRAQQRQYRKVGYDEFPIRVTLEQHQISMRKDEAARVVKLLYDDMPSLVTLTGVRDQNNGELEAASRKVHPHVSATASDAGGSYQRADSVHQPLNNALPNVKHRFFPAFGASLTHQNHNQNCSSQAHDGKVLAQCPDAMSRKPTVLGGISACGASGNTVERTSWPSPATPVPSARRPEKNDLWFTPTDSQGLSKPLHIDTVSRSRSQGSAGHVRRELDFNHISRLSVSSPGVCAKRAVPETASDDNMMKPKARRKLVDGEASHSVLRAIKSDQPRDDKDSSLKADVRDGNSSKDKARLVSMARVVGQSSILRVLPR